MIEYLVDVTKKFENKNSDTKLLLRYYLAFCYVCIGNRDKAIDELKECIPDDIYNYCDTKILYEFCLHDLYYFSQKPDLFLEIDNCYPVFEKRKLLLLKDLEKFEITHIDIECRVQLDAYFKFENSNHLLLISKIYFANKMFESAQEVLDEAQKLVNGKSLGIQCLSGNAEF